MKTIILAGGKGTRLWPLSRENMPKQFIKFFDESLFQKTVRRALIFSKPEEIFVVTNKEYKFRVLDDLEEIKIKIPEENIILEPEAKSTLPAICLAMKFAGDGKFAILPSDHIINVNEKYVEAFRIAEKICEKYLVTFGIKPRKAYTGYGYIKPSEKIDEKAFKVEEFKEKPKNAEELVKTGYLWNSGMFVFEKKLFIEELEKFIPEMLKIFEFGEKVYSEIQEISVDYGVLEKSKRVAVVPIDIEWSDFGSFDSIYDYFNKDLDENLFFGEVLSLNSKRNLVLSKKLSVLLEVEDVILIDTEDALLLTKRGCSEKIKEVYRILKNKKDKRVENLRTVYRPWGFYKVLEEGNFYKIKRVVINPGKRLSLQRHYHRSEHWIVVKGTAKIFLDGKEIILRKGESTFVPAGILHRIENPGKIPLEIIEVQIGEYLEEDDIERVEDDFGRK